MSISRERLARVVAVVAVLILIAGAAVAALRSGGGGGGAGEATPREGGVLKVGAVRLKTLDPAEASEPSELVAARLIFDTLVTYDPQSLEVRPGIAQSWEVTPDQRRFTFRLRDGLVFHDGRTPVTAADAKATLDRVARRGSTSNLRFQLMAVKGYAEWHDAGKGNGLAGVQAPDPRVLVVELTRPFALFPAVLGNPGFGVVPAAYAQGPGFAKSPVGSGPFRLLEPWSGDTVRLARFRGYWRKAAWLDAVELHVVDSDAVAFDRLEAGAFDLAPVPADRVHDAAKKFGDRGLRPFLGVLFYGMNLRSPKFADVRFRQAVVAAIDRARIVDVVYENTVMLAQGIVPKGVPEGGSDACGGRCAHDVGKARQLVAQAFPKGDVPQIAIDFDSDPFQQAIAGSIKANLAEAGIPAVLRSHDFQGYGAFLANGGGELFRLGWTADYPSADDFLYPLFVSGLPDNLTGMSNAEVDARLSAARAEPDPAKRAGLYRQAEQLVLDQFAVVPIAQFETRWAARRDVRGLVLSSLGTFDATAVYLTRPAGRR